MYVLSQETSTEKAVPMIPRSKRTRCVSMMIAPVYTVDKFLRQIVLMRTAARDGNNVFSIHPFLL